MADILHNKLGSVGDIDTAINKGAREAARLVDLAGTKRRIGLPVGLFESIYEMPAPSDLKGEKIIDLAPLLDRSSEEQWERVSEEEFDRLKDVSEDRFILAVCMRDQIKKIKANYYGQSVRVSLHNMDSVDDNGTWAISGGGSNLEADDWLYMEGSGSLRFDTDSSANAAVLTISDMEAVDLSDFVDISNVFFRLYIPSDEAAAGLDSGITIKWGSAAGAYHSKTITTDHCGNAFKKGINIVSFDWLTSAETGSPVDTAINYIQISLNKDSDLAAQSDWRIDDLCVIKGDLRDMVYYSKNRWKSSTGTYKENSTIDSDILLAEDDDEIELVINRIAYHIAKNLREKDDIELLKEEWEGNANDDGLLKTHWRLHPSEAILLTQTYRNIKTDY